MCSPAPMGATALAAPRAPRRTSRRSTAASPRRLARADPRVVVVCVPVRGRVAVRELAQHPTWSQRTQSGVRRREAASAPSSSRRAIAGKDRVEPTRALDHLIRRWDAIGAARMRSWPRRRRRRRRPPRRALPHGVATARRWSRRSGARRGARTTGRDRRRPAARGGRIPLLPAHPASWPAEALIVMASSPCAACRQN